MKQNNHIPYLSEQELDGLGISTLDVMGSIEQLILAAAQGSVWSAPKAVILPDDGRYMMAALAAATEPPVLAVKTLVLNPRNPERGLPQINGLVTLLSSDTGLPLAILDGNWITAVRTAGLSAVAAKYLASADSSSIAFIGCGVQARSHLTAFAELFPLKQIRAFGRGRKNIDKLCMLAQEKSLKPVICSTAEDALNGADIVVSSVTYSTTFQPFLDANTLKPGAFAAITDLGAPWIKESISAFDQLVIDDLAQEAAQPNKLAPEAMIGGDLSGLVCGIISGRKEKNDRTAFIFRGHALGDLALSMLAYERHQKSMP